MTRLFIPFLHIVCLCISVHQCREIPDYYGKHASDTNIHEKTTGRGFQNRQAHSNTIQRSDTMVHKNKEILDFFRN